MARLSLVSRKIKKRRKNVVILTMWLEIVQVIYRYFLTLCSAASLHSFRPTNRGRSYALDFFVNRHYIDRLVYENDVRCVDQLRMNRHTFTKLCLMLEVIGGLTPTKHMLVDEQVAMFLHILAHHVKNRTVKERFGRSAETVSRHFHRVLSGTMRLQGHLLKKPEPVPENSTDNRWRWFKNCIGALDGTYIPVTVPLEDKPRYRNRKNEIAMNVLGVCSQDGQFIYVLPGWEGSAADGRVLRDAISRTNGLKVPQGQYYLVDAGYTNCEGFLAPFRGQRYHRSDFQEGYQPANPEECYNKLHASARNVIERCWGMLKMRWAILRSPSWYPIKTHNRIVLACCLLHNLIRRNMPEDPLENEIQIESSPPNDIDDDDIITSIGTSDTWNQWRSNLANQMWNEWRATRNRG